jgi:hypothetical protein
VKNNCSTRAVAAEFSVYLNELCLSGHEAFMVLMLGILAASKLALRNSKGLSPVLKPSQTVFCDDRGVQREFEMLVEDEAILR